MNNLQPYAATVPYMGVPGEHWGRSGRHPRCLQEAGGRTITQPSTELTITSVRPPPPAPSPAGNHEAYGTQGGGKFEQFVTRNRAIAQYAGANCGSNSALYYSFETPLVHW